MKNILITGAAGFIGSYLSKRLIEENYNVIGIDNLSDYYDVTLKENRIKDLYNKDNFTFIKEDINNYDLVKNIFDKHKPNIVIHLAASAGVRYSSINPDLYINNNINGFYNVLKLSKEYNVEHFIFASSSSIYGNCNKLPLKEEYVTINQESIYASTKLCDEAIACSFSKIFNMPVTAIRPFTVYGPFGRPDMAYFSFTNNLLNNKEIPLYNNGDLKRDYTYISDAIDGIYSIIINKPKDLYNVYNIGGSKQYTTKDLVNILKRELIDNKLVDSNYNFDEYIKFTSMNKGEVYETYADISKIKKDFNYNPKISLEEGIKNFIKWYKDYYNK